MNPADYLKKSYSRCFRPIPEGGFSLYIREFPGCITEYPYDNLDEAWELLESVAESWINAALSMGQSIPEPLSSAWPRQISLSLPPDNQKHQI